MFWFVKFHVDKRHWENCARIIQSITPRSVGRVPMPRKIRPAVLIFRFQKQIHVLYPWIVAVYATAGDIMASTGRPVPVLDTVASQWSWCDFLSSRFSLCSSQSYSGTLVKGAFRTIRMLHFIPRKHYARMGSLAG